MNRSFLASGNKWSRSLDWRAYRGWSSEAAEQRDEADEVRLEARRRMVVGAHLGRAAIVNGGAGARPSQLIASVRRT
jgi:hypothetical protein